MTSDRPTEKGAPSRNPSGARLGNADPAPAQPGKTVPEPEDTQSLPAADSQPGKPGHGRAPEELEPPE